MSATVTLPLSQDGPIAWMAQGLKARLQQAFPPNLFTFAWMTSKSDKSWFEKYVPRCPAIALGWNGVTAVAESGGVFTAEASFTVALVTKNVTSPEARYMGDALAPGLFAMHRVATVILHGYQIDPDGTPWTANGPVMVHGAGHLAIEDWGGDSLAVCALDLTIRYEETPPDGLEQSPSTGILIDAINWNFGEQPPLLTDKIDTGAINV